VTEPKHASGMSPEELLLQDTYAEGARVGSWGGGAGLNPWTDPSSPQFKAWERGRFAAEGQRIKRRTA